MATKNIDSDNTATLSTTELPLFRASLCIFCSQANNPKRVNKSSNQHRRCVQNTEKEYIYARSNTQSAQQPSLYGLAMCRPSNLLSNVELAKRASR
jgi:hypothetical protein